MAQKKSITFISLLVCPANIRKKSRSAAILPWDLCFIGKFFQDTRPAGLSYGCKWLVEGEGSLISLRLYGVGIANFEGWTADETGTAT